MSAKKRLAVLTLAACLCLPAAAPAAQGDQAEQQMKALVNAGDHGSFEQDSPAPIYQDMELIREHELFSSFARNQVERMNATIIGGRSHMNIYKGSDGLFHASYRAIDLGGVVCQVRRSEVNPHFYVGSLIYKEQVLESKGKSKDSCRQGPFEPVSEKSNRLIYTSRRGGGWN